MHGGIGFTWDNDTHLWFKRAKSSEILFGDANQHREKMMQALGRLRRSEGHDHERTDRRQRPRRSPRLAEGQLESRPRPRRMAQEAVRVGLGRAALAQAMVRPRPAGEVQRRSSTRSSPSVGAVGVAKAGIRTLAAATILAHGTDLHKEKFLQRILTGEDTWCQLFSEPGSGSDMAGAVTRADKQGNKWVINGQKVWTTSAHKAHWGLLLARANWDVAKHKGLAYFVLDMKQPGVQVHPLKQMNGHASFNQVFFTDAEVEPEILVCDVGDGWTVATTTLMHERRGADGLRSWAHGLGRARAASTRRSGPRSRPRWSPTSGIRSAPAASTS